MSDRAGTWRLRTYGKLIVACGTVRVSVGVLTAVAETVLVVVTVVVAVVVTAEAVVCAWVTANL